METFRPSLRECAVLATAFKLLLFPAYKSTDFEVHRNWLAITHSLPVKEWYTESTSEWTLDYPPFFAYFEWALSQPARLFDPSMLVVKNLNHASTPTVYFQRLSVLTTELLLLYALHRYIATSPAASRTPAYVAALSILLSPALLIIDHIHFQYNGFLYGLLLLSLVQLRSPATRLAGAVSFAVLLCTKHIYLYLAPAYFVFLLRVHCLGPRLTDIRPLATLKLASSVLAVFAAAAAPWVYHAQLPQLLARLFPFSRGLCHAYWAPNVWALYSFLDRLLIPLAPRLGLPVDAAAVNSVTRGLVGDTAFAVLPAVTPRMTFALTILFQAACLVKLLLVPTFETFLGAVTLCAYAAFLFGWHVHEKAVLIIIVPFSLLALKDRRYLGAFRPLAVAGHVALFPLLFTRDEAVVKVVYTLVWLLGFLAAFDRMAPAVGFGRRRFLLDRGTVVWAVGAAGVVVYAEVLHAWVWAGRWEFVPVMAVSVYSAVGVVGSWVGFSWLYFTA